MCEYVNHDTRRFILERPEGFDFEPGQGVELSIQQEPWEDEGHPFTPTSLTNDLVLEFIIKGYPESDGFTMAMQDLDAGAGLSLGDPFGSIRYRGPGVFIAAGAGITPFLAILRRLAREGALAGHKLLLSNKTEQDLICAEELRHYLGDQAHFTFTRQPNTSHDTHHIDHGYLRGHIDDLEQYFYVCGPDAFVKAVNEDLINLGVDSQRLVYEH
jgi:cytochrome-b5 reductase